MAVRKVPVPKKFWRWRDYGHMELATQPVRLLQWNPAEQAKSFLPADKQTEVRLGEYTVISTLVTTHIRSYNLQKYFDFENVFFRCSYVWLTLILPGRIWRL
jgi:hypothetical protein